MWFVAVDNFLWLVHWPCPHYCGLSKRYSVACLRDMLWYLNIAHWCKSNPLEPTVGFAVEIYLVWLKDLHLNMFLSDCKLEICLYAYNHQAIWIYAIKSTYRKNSRVEFYHRLQLILTMDLLICFLLTRIRPFCGKSSSNPQKLEKNWRQKSLGTSTLIHVLFSTLSNAEIEILSAELYSIFFSSPFYIKFLY